ncbi:hypothetical protein [Agaribacter marinus]|uniref:Phage shock protein B n=1 Tax=Agaribacter marinus TaxID=1431249 RepID=A0AA37WH31_9ALTE|nr:hypothetical protein [Agaribacter marinus]GLR70816.1 hypothetical protein GCM10007852_17240 [Agaribacter marinus]
MSGTTVAVVAIICWALVSIFRGGQTSGKKEKLFKQRMDDESIKIEEQLANMSERIAVLEKIVTDEKYSLNKEFENLKK